MDVGRCILRFLTVTFRQYYPALKDQGAGERAPWLRALAALEEDVGSVPRIYVATDNHPVLGTQIPSSDALQACTQWTYL